MISRSHLMVWFFFLVYIYEYLSSYCVAIYLVLNDQIMDQRKRLMTESTSVSFKEYQESQQKLMSELSALQMTQHNIQNKLDDLYKTNDELYKIKQSRQSKSFNNTSERIDKLENATKSLINASQSFKFIYL